ncbi:MAG: nuclear transport factor 2 family protein [Flavisolibacter sp.]
MIKKAYWKGLVLILTITAQQSLAQTKDAGVRQAINNLFQGMKSSDTALIRAAFSSSPILQTIVTNKEGKTVVENEPLDSFIHFISLPHTQTYDERIRFDVVKIDADLAMVWAPYSFYLGARFSHCGVDSFQLVKENGNWKIQYLVDTRRRQGCAP